MLWARCDPWHFFQPPHTYFFVGLWKILRPHFLDVLCNKLILKLFHLKLKNLNKVPLYFLHTLNCHTFLLQEKYKYSTSLLDAIPNLLLLVFVDSARAHR